MSPKIKICKESDCVSEQTAEGYCRLHYLKSWKKIRTDKKKKSLRALNKNVDNIINMNFIPSWYKLWLVVSSILVVWDCLYIFYRPDTMKGGKYFQYFFPYETYLQIDPLYGNLSDSFVVLQSQCNVVEIILVVLSMLVYAGKSIRAKSAGSLLCLVASCFTFWKTVIYVMYGYKGLVFAKGNELIVLGPSSSRLHAGWYFQFLESSPSVTG